MKTWNRQRIAWSKWIFGIGMLTFVPAQAQDVHRKKLRELPARTSTPSALTDTKPSSPLVHLGEVRFVRLNRIGEKRIRLRKQIPLPRVVPLGLETWTPPRFQNQDLSTSEVSLIHLPTKVDNTELPQFPNIVNPSRDPTCASHWTGYYQGAHHAKMTETPEAINPNDFYCQESLAQWFQGTQTVKNLAHAKALLLVGYILEFSTNIGSILSTKTAYRQINGFLFARSIQDTFDGQWTSKLAAIETDLTLRSQTLTLVGYDDEAWIDLNGNGKREPIELGVYKIANTFGRQHDDAGFTYVHSTLFQKTVTELRHLVPKAHLRTTSRLKLSKAKPATPKLRPTSPNLLRELSPLSQIEPRGR